MKKVKNHCFVCFWFITVYAIAVQPFLYGQDYLSRDRENEIKMSGQYYWGEGSDFIEELAKLSAFVELSNQIIQDAVVQSEQLDEILKAIEMGAHLEQLPQQGKIKILAWIAKDNVLVTVTTQRPITRNEPQAAPPVPAVQQPQISDPPPAEHVPMREMPQVSTDNTVLMELAACRTYNEVRRVATMNGLVRGVIGGGSSGFLNPADCIIAVFTADGTLSALLDNGNSSRLDLLSGQTVQNPEQYYNQGEYYLWYMQQKTTYRSESANFQNEYNLSSTSLQPPPIENTNSYANARVLLPKDWDGTSILVNSFTWVWDSNEDDDYTTVDNDETYYRYPLSPNVVFEAGVHLESNPNFSPVRMTVNEFTNYMYNLGYAIEGQGSYGFVAVITYENNMITKIVEKYIP